MNVYALLPLIAAIAYIPLLITTVSSRPWQRQHKLFTLFLIAAVLWSLIDILLRSYFFQQHNLILGKLILIMFTWMAVQLHCFTSSFFSPSQGRWLPFAYASLAVVIALAALGYIPEDVVVSGKKLYPVYGKWVVFIAIPLLALFFRNVYVFRKRLRVLGNPVMYNQIISLLISLCVLAIFALATLLPLGREFPIAHFGGIIIAFILSYATIRHQLIDIRIVLRRGLAWVSLGIIGAASYVLLFVILHAMLPFELDLTTTFMATLVAIVVAIFIYKLRGYLFVTIGKVFQGQSYDYRQKLSDFADKIQNVFSLKEQGGELLALVTKAVGSKRACLLFPESGSGNFTAQVIEPKGKSNPLFRLGLREQNPIVKYLKQEQKTLTRGDLAILPELRGLWEQERGEIEASEIELFMPLISRDRLIGVLVLAKKRSGRYSLEDFNLLEDVADQVAVSMEKEYLREQLREREDELSLINRSTAIITSSLNIQGIYGNFIEELKKEVDVSWTAIILIEEDSLHLLALSSEIGSAWRVGERIPIKGTATEWVANHKQALVESDLLQESKFSTGRDHLKQGVRSIAYLPLIVKDKAIGSLIVSSRHPNAYSNRHLNLLQQLASQIAMPIENSRLYAEVEEKTRTDELTGLFNRRSLDEVITGEVNRYSRYGGVFSLIILDLDHFKAFNDNYGHLAGDKILREVGSIIKNSIRSADRAFRYGGDEFAILLPNTSINATNQVVERIRKQIASKVLAGSIPVTASLGLASWPANGTGADDVIAAADAALYHAKRSGGNRSHVL
ncbi:diguanylate cyclase [Chloroflexota bacterium]